MEQEAMNGIQRHVVLKPRVVNPQESFSMPPQCIIQMVYHYQITHSLNPTERHYVFMERLKKHYSPDKKGTVESAIWNFALTEPIVKFKHQYEKENIFFFMLIMGVMYGIFAFVVKMLVIREEKWNLI